MARLIDFFSRQKTEDTAFAQLVAPHVKTLYRMAYRWTRHDEDAEDLVQDVLVKVLSRMEELRSKDKPGPWLVKVLYHRYVDVYRHRKASPVDEHNPADEEFTAEGQTEDSERYMLQQALQKALYELEPEQREVVILHDVEGYTAVEAGEIMAISVGTVKSRLHRARNRLKETLDDGTF
ncbi:MAG: RNA polymerase sigma factor [Ketobacteraceae bacterium]|nr:RNA polymerase sigma factor [Ketobacteraceae bacterium]